MKSFKQYISESLTDIMAYNRDFSASTFRPRQRLITIRGLINPSREQLVGFLRKVPIARFTLHNDKLHVWNADEAIHDEVLRAEHPDQRERDRDYYDRILDMQDHKKSVLGSFFAQGEDDFGVGLSNYRNPEKSGWMHDLIKSHPRTSHLIKPHTTIEAYDM